MSALLAKRNTTHPLLAFSNSSPILRYFLVSSLLNRCAP
jgi:hypothetical protein